MSNAHPPRTPREILEYAREQDVRMVDLRFCDLLGS